MGILASELAQVAPKNPQYSCAVDNYIVTVNLNSSESATMPNGSFVVFDTTTETARAFTGLDTSTGIYDRATGAVAAGGYAWTAPRRQNCMWRIDPATGGVSTLGSFVGGVANLWIASGDYIFGISNSSPGGLVYKISTNTKLAVNDLLIAGAVAPDGSIYAYNSATNKMRHWLSDMTYDTEWTSSGSPIGVGVTYGGSLWWGNGGKNIVAFNMTSHVTTTYSHSALGAGNNTGTFTSLGGWLYNLSDTGQLIGFDPSSGVFGKESLSPSRGHRSHVIEAAGKLWVPSGEPLT